MFKVDKKQQQLLNNYFAIEKTYQPNHWSIYLVVVLFAFVSFVLTLVPVSSLDLDQDFVPNVIMPLCWSAIAALNFTNIFRIYYENPSDKDKNGQKSMVQILTYLPIEKAQFEFYCIKKLLKPLSIYTLIVLVLRVAIAFGTCGIGFWDFAFPILSGFIVPVLFQLLASFLDKSV